MSLMRFLIYVALGLAIVLMLAILVGGHCDSSMGAGLF